MDVCGWLRKTRSDRIVGHPKSVLTLSLEVVDDQ